MDGKDAPEQPSGEAKEDPVQFDPSRMIGIIKRRALIKELASAYHGECRKYCQDLLQLQRKWEEFQYIEKRVAEEARQPVRPAKRAKKGF
ncbi:hypothetical protein LUZ62_036362 [Rhynchospora pubera]|uniref:Uncharacterized protein n=1 Tax=Rhynchospora pubera TaxID=906938 RepID=A0AAV8E2T3_9POAL|nr:hypothetical protein LUZ62_057936 [Rhynchospora pubera]KAJ4785116.1 hypothetical protein LUZ62_036362 [Rhynchospora pubera]